MMSITQRYDYTKPTAVMQYASSPSSHHPQVRVLVYWLKQDPLRCSCYPVVVLASTQVPKEKLLQLQQDGALIKRVAIPEIQLNKNDVSADRWAATMGKLHVFNLTEFREVGGVGWGGDAEKKCSPAWQHALWIHLVYTSCVHLSLYTSHIHLSLYTSHYTSHHTPLLHTSTSFPHPPPISHDPPPILPPQTQSSPPNPGGVCGW